MKFAWILTLFACGIVGAAPVTFQSGIHQTALLELYTSEGCSSCPPAEAWLSKQKNATGLWRDFVPVAFHVDYWNNLGWRDRFSSDEYSERQRDYARAWSADEIYTPEFVLNGKEWRYLMGLRNVPAASTTDAGILQATSSDGKHWQATFVPATNTKDDYEVTAAVLVCNIGSDVTAGENSGRHLNHDFAALSLITRPLDAGTNGFHGSFIIDPNPKSITGRLALAVWVTHSGDLAPLQATGGWLPQP